MTRQLLLILLSVISIRTIGQTYSHKIDSAASLAEAKNYPAALDIFKNALTDTTAAGPYDLYFGAITAAQCQQTDLAFSWLFRAQKKGLGLQKDEINQIQKDSGLIVLHNDPRWT